MRLQLTSAVWREIGPNKGEIAEVFRQTGEHSIADVPAPEIVPGGSVLEAEHLVKTYRRRAVVNDVGLRLQQGEIVGLLGPNGAGKTTTFYMIVGLIEPQEGRILIDGQDITKMPMFKRARLGIGYLSQEPSIFRKLSVEDNIMAILETLPDFTGRAGQSGSKSSSTSSASSVCGRTRRIRSPAASAAASRSRGRSSRIRSS